MNYILKEDISINKLPIYFCNAVINLEKINRNKRITYDLELNKVILKGETEDDLKKQLLSKKEKLLNKREFNKSKIKNVKIELVDFLGFGVEK